MDSEEQNRRRKPRSSAGNTFRMMGHPFNELSVTGCGEEGPRKIRFGYFYDGGNEVR